MQSFQNWPTYITETTHLNIHPFYILHVLSRYCHCIAWIFKCILYVFAHSFNASPDHFLPFFVASMSTVYHHDGNPTINSSAWTQVVTFKALAAACLFFIPTCSSSEERSRGSHPSRRLPAAHNPKFRGEIFQPVVKTCHYFNSVVLADTGSNCANEPVAISSVVSRED